MFHIWLYVDIMIESVWDVYKLLVYTNMAHIRKALYSVFRKYNFKFRVDLLTSKGGFANLIKA